jgi:hypothetical protein
MCAAPLDLTLESSARSRFEVVEMHSRLSSEHREALVSYPRCLSWSAHTTAGFLDRSLIRRLGYGHVSGYVDTLASSIVSRVASTIASFRRSLAPGGRPRTPRGPRWVCRSHDRPHAGAQRRRTSQRFGLGGWKVIGW